MNKIKLLYASSVSSTYTIILITAIIIYAEFDSSFKDWLKSITGHHWVTKSWIVVLVYLLGLAACYKYHNKIDNAKLRYRVLSLIHVSLVCSMVLIGFFTWHALWA